MFQKKFQKGRSTIEILAVVCLIGALTIGALQLYSYVISKNQANNIQTRSNERAASIMTSPALAGAKVNEVLEALGFPEKDGGYNWKHRKLSENTFSVEVSFVRKKACDILMGMDFSYLERMEVNNKCAWAPVGSVCDKNAECREEGNAMMFVYSGTSLKRTPACAPNQRVCGFSCCESTEACIRSSSKEGISICCPKESDINCDGHCCPSGTTCCGTECCSGKKTCCGDSCYGPCEGVGLSGMRDQENCVCACDESKGFKLKDGVCQCDTNRVIKDGACVCAEVPCDTSTGAYIENCLCTCPANKVLSSSGVCVECDDTDDCNIENCEGCVDHQCKGQCCSKSKESCADGAICCNGLDCVNDVCCVGTKGECNSGDECCNSSFSCENHMCCAPKGSVCSSVGDCCDGKLNCDKTTGETTVCCVGLQKEGCSSASDCCGGIPCSGDNVCCRERKTQCFGSGECCKDLPCTDGLCCVGKKKTGCTENEDCCGTIACTSGTCCMPLRGECSDMTDCCNERNECANNGEKEGTVCCVPKRETGCTENADCCGTIACTSGTCCMPLRESCTEATDCCSENNACMENEKGETVCCLPKRETGCTEDADCCGTMSCSGNMCCVPLRATCTEASDCCNEAADCPSETGKCCLPLQVSGCIAAEDCCNSKECTQGTCCIDHVHECTSSEECCGYNADDNTGYLCKEGVSKCCPSDGICAKTEECQQCCVNSQTPVCSWSKSGSSATSWTGSCEKKSLQTAIFGRDPDSDKERCCTAGEYLVPAFSNAIEKNPIKRGYSYCCPDRNASYNTVAGGSDDVMKYAYYNEFEHTCTMLGECPTPYDGIAIILDMSSSMVGSSRTPNYMAMVKDVLRELFRDTKYDWSQIKVGIYTFGSVGDIELPYGTHNSASLVAAINSLSTMGDTCTACGLGKAIENTLGSGKNAPLYILLTDGYENTYYGGGEQYCGETRAIYTGIKTNGGSASYCINDNGTMRGINVPLLANDYIRPERYEVPFTSKGNGTYRPIPLSMMTRFYQSTCRGVPCTLTESFAMTAISSNEISGSTVTLTGYDYYAKLVGSDVVHWNSGDGSANHPVHVRTTGTLTGRVYASALDNVRKINTACSAFGGRNIYAYSLGGDYLGKSGLVQTGVLTDKEAIKRAFEGAFAVFENCIPPKETQKCR